MRIPFVKMEGAGNDYVFVDGMRCDFPLPRAPELARRWSDRHFGIGGDGLIVLLRGDRAPVRMAMWNADGSRGAMCGNGLRCIARLAHEHGHVAGRTFEIDTDAGSRRVELLPVGGRPGDPIDAVVASMGAVRCGEPTTIHVAGHTLSYVPGDAGNPHAAVFVDDVERADVVAIGSAMQRAAAFPDGVNVEFVQVLGDDTLRQRTFERGSGETLACGTGAAVAALASRQLGHTRGECVAVHLRGGTLRVRLGRSSLAIEGPARTVFRGEIDLAEQFDRLESDRGPSLP